MASPESGGKLVSHIHLVQHKSGRGVAGVQFGIDLRRGKGVGHTSSRVTAQAALAVVVPGFTIPVEGEQTWTDALAAGAFSAPLISS